MDQFEKKVKKWAKKQPKAVGRGLEKAAQMVRSEAVKNHLSGPKMTQGVGSRTNATLQPGTGDLRSSINTKVSVGKTKQNATVGTSMLYARIHEKGGVIKPKNKKSLRFTIGSQVIFAKKVTIPKRPFLKPSLAKKRSKIDDVILEEIMREYKRA